MLGKYMVRYKARNVTNSNVTIEWSRGWERERESLSKKGLLVRWKSSIFPCVKKTWFNQ